MPADGSLFGPIRPRIVDLFAGIGGTSTGVALALGRDPDVAINHWDYAIRMHQRNHPGTVHFLEDVWNVGPREAARGMPVDLLVGSPDCTDHSNAKNGVPKSTGRRALADVFVRWARDVRPNVIILENVREFLKWGPLHPSNHPIEKLRGQPIADRRGEEFRRWVAELQAEGYVVEWRVLNAADYGAPQARKRLFVVARCDGQPIVWPEPTHGEGLLPQIPAAAVVDFDRPTRSIFGRKKPLATNTLKRIAAGVVKYVIESQEPFLLQLTHGGRLVPLDRPLPTITAAHRGEFALVAPSLIETGNGERPGQAPRCRDIQRPLFTVTASGSQGALVAAFLAKHYTGVIGSPLDKPLGTVTATDHHSLVAAHLTKFYGTSVAGVGLNQPLPTITAGGGRGGGHAGLVAAFLTRYYTQGGNTAPLHRPLPTVTAREGLQLVTVQIDGHTYVIEDIQIRMLHSSELLLGQGFPADYHLEGSESDRITGIGNSVVPQVMAALVSANCASGARRAA